MIKNQNAIGGEESGGFGYSYYLPERDGIFSGLLMLEFLAKEKVESHILSGVDICLTEALNNIIKHAYKGEQNNPIEVIVSKDSNQLELLLIDCGRPRDNFVIKDLEFDPNDIENLPENLFAEKVMQALKEGTTGKGRGFVLMPSASPYGRKLSVKALRNYEIMVDLAEKFNPER